jgi:hypothetical protein
MSGSSRPRTPPLLQRLPTVSTWIERVQKIDVSANLSYTSSALYLDIWNSLIIEWISPLADATESHIRKIPA